MSWCVVVRPDAQGDIVEAARWYEDQKEGLGALETNPLLNCRQHPRKNIRWRYPDRFPYRVIYEVIEPENIVVIAAVLHAARHDRHWKKRI